MGAWVAKADAEGGELLDDLQIGEGRADGCVGVAGGGDGSCERSFSGPIYRSCGAVRGVLEAL